MSKLSMTKDEFFRKLDYEGGFEGLADYMGHKEITDDPDLHMAWHSFVEALRDLQAIQDDWVDPDEEELDDL